MAAPVKVNFTLATYTPPTLNEINFGLNIYAPSLDGDDFALLLYTPPALDAVNFELVRISFGPIIIVRILAETLGVVIDSTARAITRIQDILEPAISVSDVIERAVVKIRDVSEP